MTDERHTHASNSNDPLERILADAGLDIFPAEIQRDVDTILASGQGLEPEARRRFVDAAQRGTKQWNLRALASLETILFEARRQQDKSADSIGEVIGLDAETLRSLERGDDTLDAQPAELVASWAFNVGVDRPVLDDALRRSLSARGTAGSYAGTDHPHLDSQQAEFVERVLDAYDKQSRVEG